MSVRRLAEEALQPEGFKFNAAKAAEAKVWVKKYPKGREQSAVIPLLMLAQEQDGWVTRPAIEEIAAMLNMPLIRVMEVATFYTQFMLQPVGTRAHVQVCGTTPCMLRGAEDLRKVCERKINAQQFHRNEGGTLSWEEVECQGACVNAPMVMIGRDTYEDLTPERLEEIIDAFEAGKGGEIKPGPQIDRVFSAPAGGLTTLLSEDTGKVSRKSGKANADQKMTKAAKPKTDAMEGEEAIAPPDEAEGPGTRKSSKSGPRAKTSDSGPTLNIASTASAMKPKAKAASKDTNRSEDNDVTPRSKAKPSEKTSHKKPAEGGKPLSIMQTVGAAKSVKPKAKPKSAAEANANPTMKLAATASGRGKAGATDEKGKPEGIKKPKSPDDLKMIAGIGPKIESTLNGLGIWTWKQVAGWKKAERDWVDGYLSFKGRIEREDWVNQAKALAKGGRDEYVKVFGKEPR